MKKTFRTLLAGALALCAVACYDDSALQEDLAGVKEDLSALQAEFETFKKNLNDEVAALKTSYQTLNGSFTEYKGLNDTQVAALNTALNTLKGQLGADENSGIRGQIAEVISQLNAYKTEANGRLTTAEAAIEALKTNSALKTELEALAAKVDLKADAATLAALAETVESITVRGIKEENGKIVVTLANGETLSISKDGEGVVKVVDGNWVVVGADGTETDLELPVSTPNLQFDIDWRTGDLYYSTDGLDIYDEDKEWISTGIAVSGGRSGDVAVIGRVDVWSGEGQSVDIMVDNEWYTLPLIGDSEASLELLAGKTIVPVGGEKIIQISAIGLSDVYVMSKPDGWKAVINGNKLTVTAPVEGNPYAEQDGLVLLHGTTEGGQCIVAKLAVTTSTAGVDVTVDTATGSVVFRNGIVMPDMGGGIEPLSVEDEVMPQNFAPFYLGIIDRESWGYVEEYGAEMLMQCAFMSENVLNGNPDFTVAVDGSAQVISTNVNALWNVRNIDPMMEGAQMVVFAVPMSLEMNESYGNPVFDDISYSFYTPSINKIELLSATHSDIALMVSRSGADYYYIAFGPAEEIEPGVFDCGMQGTFMEWQYREGQFAFGARADAVMNERVLLSEYGSEGETSILKPSTTYYVFAFPLTEGKSAKDYSYENDFLPYVYYFTTEDIQSGGTGEVSIAKNEGTTYSTLVADITVSGNAEYVYYKSYSTNPADDFDDETALLNDIIASGKIASSDEVATERIYSLSAGTTRYIAAFAVDAEGLYGGITVTALKTNTYPYDEDGSIVVSVDGVKFEEYVEGEGEDAQTRTRAIVTYNVSGADYLMVTGSWGDPCLNAANVSTNTLVSNMMSSVNNMYVKYYQVTEGKVTVTYESYTADFSKYSHATGFNMTNSKVTELCEVVKTDISEYEK